MPAAPFPSQNKASWTIWEVQVPASSVIRPHFVADGKPAAAS